MSVLALFGAVKNLINPKNKGADISSNAFRVARWMGIFMVGCSILTSSKQFFGEPIQCKSHYFSPNMFASYCFMAGTITVLEENQTQFLSGDQAHLGISAEKSGRVMRHNYYQWVPFILFLQAILFYAPYRMWKTWEGGKLTKLLAKVSFDPLTETPLTDQVQGISKFLSGNPGWYSSFARKMVFCETAILVVSVLQMYLLDLVFGGHFFSLGSEFMNASYTWEHYRIVERVFPLVTNCDMDYIGSGGSPVTDSGVCLLSVNILNQKIFMLSWYLHIFIIVFSALKVLYDLFLVLAPGARYLMLRNQAASLPSHLLSRINRRSGFGDFTLLMLIAKNIDEAQFETLLTLLSDSIATGNDTSYPSSLIHMSALHSTEKKDLEYGPNGKQPSYPENAPTIDVRMRKNSPPPPGYRTYFPQDLLYSSTTPQSDFISA